MKKHYNCYSARMAGYLLMTGFVVLEMRKDQKTRRNVFIFNDSEELNEAIEDYKKL